MMKLTKLVEPELEFGGRMRHVDIRHGIIDNGVFDAGLEGSPSRIRIGIVGSAETVDGTARWIEQCAGGIEAKQSRQPNLFPAFPGLGEDSPFRCAFTTPSELQQVMSQQEISRLAAIADRADAIAEVVASIVREIATLIDRNAPPNVVLIALPIPLIERLVNDRAVEPTSETDDVETETASSPEDVDFHGALKAACMRMRVPIQILWPTTYDASVAIPRKIKETSTRRVQDDATRAWNFCVALYYKAGGLPWRLARDTRDYKTSFVGLSFYRSLDRKTVHTSTAQMFDERGEGLILRGGRLIESKRNRVPHMTAEDAYALLKQSLDVFRKMHSHPPARVVVHKSSKFDDEEMDGLSRALEEQGIEMRDFIAISKSGTRLYREGAYPPLRGTYLHLDAQQALLYTRGSVEYFRTYPGEYVPRPLLLRHQALARPLRLVAEEVLALTKMNWNNTQFDNAMPVTLAASRVVGNVLKHVADDQEIAPRFSFYM